MFNATSHLQETGMKKNRGGGRSFVVDPWDQLVRTLILGTEGGTYYASESDLTQGAIKLIDKLIAEDGPRVVKTTVEISEAGRAPKNDYAIFVLARAAVVGDERTRFEANSAMPKVCRIGTHLFQWAQYLKAMGKGPASSGSRRRALEGWYFGRKPEDLLYQVMKYQSRKIDGRTWTHRDIMRLLRPKVDGSVIPQANVDTVRNLVGWMVNGWDSVGPEPHPDAVLERLWAYERLKATDDLKEVLRLIKAYRLPHDVVDGKWKGGKHAAKVWAALIETGMPYTALMRNLGNMSKSGYLVPGTQAVKDVTQALTNDKAISKSRVHPFSILTALMTYGSGHSVRGKGTWTAVKGVTNALDAAFYKSFGNIEDTGKDVLVCLDVSGSMAGGYYYQNGRYQSGGLMGVPGLSARIASAAMAMIWARTHTKHRFMAFSQGFIPINIQDGDSLQEVIDKTSRLPFSSTDCSLPMQYALQVAKREGRVFDAMVVYTDSETNCNRVAPHVALQDFRRQTGSQGRSVVMAMTADRFTIADPNDPGMLDMCGLDSAGPSLITDFFKGSF